MKILRHILTLCSLLLITASGLIYATETRIIGNLMSANTGEPIANASIYFKGTKVGTTSDEHGNFYLHVDLMRTGTLVISSVGYKTQKLTVEPGKDIGSAILLEEKNTDLEEVIILPGTNPALALMDSVRAHKKENTPPEKSYFGDTEQDYYLCNITGKMLKRRLWKSLQSGMMQMEDSTYVLPLPANMYASLAAPMPAHLDFYRSTIPFGQISFLSPTAASAGGYYRYYLIDSLSTPKRYIIDFRPKNSFNPLFTGRLVIDSTNYALCEVEASLPKESNVNFLSAMQYTGQYEGYLIEEQLTAVMDMAVKTDSSHTFPALLAKQRYKATALSVPKAEEPMFGFTDQIQLNTPEWTSPAPASLPVDTPPLIRFASWLGYIVHTGYIPTGTAIDIGNIVELLQYNRYEQLHIGLPFRTNDKLFPHVSLEGYVGYGLRDRGIKYKIMGKAILPTTRRNLLGVYYWDHYTYSEVSEMDACMHENSIGYGSMSFTTYAFSDLFYKGSQGISSAVRNRELKIWAESDWLTGHGAVPSIETRLSIQTGRMGYGDPMAYHYYDMPSFHKTSISGLLRLSWHESVADIYTTRKHLYSSYPTLFIGGELGSYSMNKDGKYNLFSHLDVLLRQDLSLGMGGTLTYALQGSVTFGGRNKGLPYPLLHSLDGNNGYTFDPYRFTFINNNQYIADRFVALQANWNGQGVLFNHIPGVRYLRLRELAEMKFAYTGISAANFLQIPEFITSPSQGAYAEIGIGIGNILRIGEVYSIWRLTNRDNLTTPRWAIRFRLHLGM